MTHPSSPGTTSVPLRRFGGTCLSRPPLGGTFSGGTRSSGPLFDVGSSIAFHRGLKSHVESGAKAPHSMECGDLSWSAAIYRRFLVKALAFTISPLVEISTE
ncbi:hypothetical protein THTE_0044 [Thermogutta terrifontis]|uniref:Uncharacterized protein n=1 Tax=Thermogutta terrifontis TaxID=1331910 RepID=A0A286R9L1_9BACT|nr:hypothetical protein THTE_0044 [Thermogutta terrifontis]